MTTDLPNRTESRRELLLWVLAISAAIATGIGTRSYLRERTSEARAAAEARFHPTPVVVARNDLAPGTELGPQQLAVRNMPAAYLPANTVGAPQARDVVGRTTEHAVRAGEPIQIPLLKALVHERLAQRIALGRRALTLAVDESAAIAGLLTPGDRVDLRWRGGGRRAISNVPVIATGSRYLPGDGDAAPTEFATITLELNDAEARLLAEADLGDLRVLLRNPADTGSVDLPRERSSPAESRPGITLIIGGHGGPMPAVQMLTAVGP